MDLEAGAGGAPEPGPERVPEPSPAREPSGLLEVGRVVKPHALRGEVVVELLTNRDDRLAAGTVLADRDGGELVVVTSSPHHHRWIVRFEGVDTIDAAEQLRGTTLFAAPMAETGTLWVHELIGAEVVEVSGVPRGTVESVQANPASDLLVLSGGGLVPLRFVVGHEPGVRVVIDPPDGLFELD